MRLCHFQVLAVFWLMLPGSGLRLKAQPSSSPRQDFWATDGAVYAMAETNGLLYIGGSFTFLANTTATGAGAALDLVTGQIEAKFPKIDGIVNTAIPDGAGGWYIGGLFKAAEGGSNVNIAHIGEDQTLDHNWAASVSGSDGVLTLQRAGNILYAGGGFTNVNDLARTNLAALDSVTGAVLPFNQPVGGTVRALLIADQTLYLGGEFTNVAGAARQRLAAIDTSTGQVRPWDPAPSGAVVALAGDTNAIYAAGAFTQIGGRARRGLAEIDPVSGAVSTNFNPWITFPTGQIPVRALFYGRGFLYIGGSFTAINRAPMPGLAAFDFAGRLAAFNPNNPNNFGTFPEVYTLTAAGRTLYVGGRFTRFGGQSRTNLAAVDLITARLQDWNPNASSDVFTLAVSGNRIYAGGSFNRVGGVARANLAALDIRTGRATSWNPSASSNVYALAIGGDKVFVGGDFLQIGSSSVRRLAAVDLNTGSVLPWNPNPDQRVMTLGVSSNSLFMGGRFTRVAGVPRNRLAAIDISTGRYTPWDPNAFGSEAPEVRRIAISGNQLFAVGSFTNIGGQIRHHAASFDLGSQVYLGGAFSKIGVQFRTHLGAVSLADAKPALFDPRPDAPVEVLTISSNLLYIGGLFQSVTGERRNFAAAINLESGSLLPWRPSFDMPVAVLLVAPNGLYAGGDFFAVDGIPSRGLAVFSFDTLDSGTGAVRFEGARRGANGSFAATVAGAATGRLVFQATTDLVSWTTLETRTLSGGPFEAQLSDAAGQFPRRFYRIIVE